MSVPVAPALDPRAGRPDRSSSPGGPGIKIAPKEARQLSRDALLPAGAARDRPRQGPRGGRPARPDSSSPLSTADVPATTPPACRYFHGGWCRRSRTHTAVRQSHGGSRRERRVRRLPARALSTSFPRVEDAWAARAGSSLTPPSWVSNAAVWPSAATRRRQPRDRRRLLARDTAGPPCAAGAALSVTDVGAETQSYRDFARLSAHAGDDGWFFDQYLSGEADSADWRVSPCGRGLRRASAA